MFAALFTVATLALAAFASEVTINTPKSVTQCQEVTITWQGGKAPYKVSVVKADNPCDEALVELPETNDTWFKWQNPQLNPGSKVVFAIEDGSDDEAWSGEVTIQKGTTATCSAVVSSSAAPASGTTLDVPPAAATTTVAPVNAGDDTGSQPAAPGGAISAAISSKGGFVAAGMASFVALVSVVSAL